MSAGTIFSIALILFFGSTAQSAVGFGFGLIAIPVLVWIGISLPITIALICMSTFIQSAVGLYQLRSYAVWKQIIPAALIRYAAMPVGLLILTAINMLSKDQLKQIVGLIILVIIILQLTWRIKPKDHIHSAWGVTAFVCSGIMGSMVGLGSPPLIIWLMAHNWSTQKMRAFILALFLSGAPVLTLLLYWKFGGQVLWGTAIGLAAAPVMILGSISGVQIGNLISQQKLRVTAYVFLLFIALSSIVTPMIS
jgi:uncharacterized protein